MRLRSNLVEWESTRAHESNPPTPGAVGIPLTRMIVKPRSVPLVLSLDAKVLIREPLVRYTNHVSQGSCYSYCRCISNESLAAIRIPLVQGSAVADAEASPWWTRLRLALLATERCLWNRATTTGEQETNTVRVRAALFTDLCWAFSTLLLVRVEGKVHNIFALGTRGWVR